VWWSLKVVHTRIISQVGAVASGYTGECPANMPDSKGCREGGSEVKSLGRQACLAESEGKIWMSSFQSCATWRRERTLTQQRGQHVIVLLHGALTFFICAMGSERTLSKVLLLPHSSFFKYHLTENYLIWMKVSR
jgi:hypothetical protein